MNIPAFSVLTPSYNYARFIGDALASTADQSIGIEHVVVDGASTDETVDVLAAADHGRLRWRSEPDRGQSDALNKAFALSSGDWIGWLNADEFYLPGAFEAVAAAIARAPDVDVVVGSAVFVDADARFERLLCHHRFSAAVLRAYGCYLLSSSVFIRRSALPAEPWDVDLRTVMDWDLFLALANAGCRFATIEQPLSAFRVHAEQVTAVPMRADDPELQRVRSRWNIPEGAARRHFGRAQHAALRVVDGCYREEMRARRRFARQDMRWFASADTSPATALIEAVRND